MPFVNINLRKKKNNFVVPDEAPIPSITVSLNSSRVSLETELIEEVLEKLDLTKSENASTLTKTHFFNSVLNLDEKSPDFQRIDDEKDKKSFLNLRIQSATSKESEKPKRKTTFDGLPIFNVNVFRSFACLSACLCIFCLILGVNEVLCVHDLLSSLEV